MSSPPVSVPPPVGPDVARTTASRWWASPALLSRAIWIVMCVVGLVVFGVTVPARSTQLMILAAGHRAPMATLGLPPEFLSRYIVALDIALVLACCVIAGVILWRIPRRRVPAFVALMLVLYGFYVTRPPDALQAVGTEFRGILDGFRALSQVCILAFAYIFPDGRWVPPWTRRLLVVWAGLTVLWLLFPSLPLNTVHLGPDGRMSLPAFITLLAWLGSGGYAQVYRYRHVASPVQRQQTKWIMLGVLGALGGFVAFQLPALAVHALSEPGLPRLVYVLAGVPALYACALMIPLAIGVSVLHYRLWDVDVLINRTLVYGSLTGSLALVYLACVLAFQVFFGSVAGNIAQVPLIVSVSTLATAALFLPLRRSLQTVIDRRFYRHKYDAARMLSEFGDTLHDNVDLETLAERLVGAVDETMQPAHISLWLRPTVDVEHPRLTEDKQKPPS